MKSVRFGNRGALKIVEPDILETIQSGIESTIGYSISKKRHSLLNHKNLRRLSKTPHQVGVNTLGQRFLLLLTTIQVEGKSKRYSIFINRKSGMMIVVRFRFSSDLFKGAHDTTAFPCTLFEGELVRIKEGKRTDWYYVISDILIDCGKLTRSVPLEGRLERLTEIIDKSHVPDQKQDPCSIQVKQYFEYKHIRSIVDDYVMTLPYKDAVTGLAFKSTKTDMLYILPEFRSQKSEPRAPRKEQDKKKKITISRSAIKERGPAVKRSSGSDDCFKVVETDMPDVFELYNRTGERVGYAAVPDLECSTLLNNLLETVDDTGEDLFMKCNFSEKFSKWVPTERCSPF